MRRLVDVQNVIREAGNEMCLALLALHAFIDCDTSFLWKGKLIPLKILR